MTVGIGSVVKIGRASTVAATLLLSGTSSQPGLAPIAVTGTISDSTGTTWTLNIRAPDGTDAAAMLSATSGAISGGSASPSSTFTPTFLAGAGTYVLWLTDNAGNRSLPLRITIGDVARRLVRLNLANATVINGTKVTGNTSLGETSRVEIASGVGGHGNVDADLDAYGALIDLGAKPAAATRIRVRLVVPNPPASNGTGGNCSIAPVIIPNSAAWVVNRGHHCELRINTSNVLQPGLPARIGTYPSASGTLTGVLIADMAVFLDASSLGPCVHHHITGNTGALIQNENLAWVAGAVTSILVGVAVGARAASLGATLDWGSGIEMWAGWA